MKSQIKAARNHEEREKKEKIDRDTIPDIKSMSTKR